MSQVTTSQGTGRVVRVAARETVNASTLTERAYHELRENPHFEIDGLQRLHENLSRLEELHGRLHFMMKEIATLTRK
ncbi:MAG: hypothetical protein JNJ49_03725 [Bdellovibrionaceae bacterium]|nr:hypothetical protein [Pseudobdellovibrionaceae bacterium]